MIGVFLMDRSFIIKANLMCDGINVDDKAKEFLNILSPIWLMNDYITCTGVTLVFANQYATVDVNPESKFTLTSDGDDLYIVDDKGEAFLTKAITPPDYMKDEIWIEGKSITTYVNTYTDRVRIQLLSGCANACKFCNAVECEYEFNSITGLDTALQIALSQSKIRHGLLSSGNAKTPDDIERLTDMYKFFTQKYKDLDIDLMTPPRGFRRYKEEHEYETYLKYVKEIGVYGISTNIELNSPEYLQRYCKEKADVGQRRYLDFIEKAVDIFGKNYVRSLIIVGLEPLEETLKGVEKLAKIGCNPVLSPLFPYGEAVGFRSPELFIEARERSEEICDKYDIKLGPVCVPCAHNTL
jgi:hypothetical protein